MSNRTKEKTSRRCPLCRRSGHHLEECTYLPSEFLETREGATSTSEREQWSVLAARFRKSFESTRKAVPFACDLAVLLGVLEDEETPSSERALAAAAIRYFLDPLDAIPDKLPIFGYADDAVVVYLALSKLLDSITDEHIAVSQKLMVD